jgi:lipopolysaccharide export system protein LptA
MKTILFILLAVGSGAVWAQTNLALPKNPASAKTVITSDSATFDNNTQQQVFLGNVVVVDPRITLYCHRLLVIVPKKGERLSHLTAETNVVIDFVDPEKHETNHLTANIAIYNYAVVNSVTNETVTFTGTPGHPPRVVTAQGIINSEPLIWDRAANKFIFKSYSMELQQSITDTNSTSPVGNFLK